MANPQLTKGGAAATVPLTNVLPSGTSAPGSGYFSVWDGSTQVVPNTSYSGGTVTVNGLTFVYTSGTNTSVSLQLANGTTLTSFSGAQVLFGPPASGLTYSGPVDIVAAAAGTTSLPKSSANGYGAQSLLTVNSTTQYTGTANSGFYTYLASGADPYAGSTNPTLTPLGTADANGLTVNASGGGSTGNNFYASISASSGAAPAVGNVYKVVLVYFSNTGNTPLYIFQGQSTYTIAAAIVAPTAAPTLTAQGGQGGNTITYSAPPAGATVLYLYRGTAAGGEGTQPIAYTYPTAGQGGNIVDSGANNGVTSYYKAVWGNGAGNGPQSNEVTASATAGSGTGVVSGYSNIVTGTPNASLLPPTQVTLQLGDGVGILTWVPPAVGSAIGVVYRQTVTSGPVNAWILAMKIAASTPGNPATLPTGATVSGLTDGVSYDFATFTYA